MGVPLRSQPVTSLGREMIYKQQAKGGHQMFSCILVNADIFESLSHELRHSECSLDLLHGWGGPQNEYSLVPDPRAILKKKILS